MLESGGIGIIVKRPLEKLVKLDPLWLLKRGEILAAELAQEHKLLFTQRDVLNYVREHNLGNKLEKIYTDLIFGTFRDYIYPDSLFYLSLLNDGSLSCKDVESYKSFTEENYPNIAIHVSEKGKTLNFVYFCREAFKKLNKTILIDEEIENHLIDLDISFWLHDSSPGD
mgnify:CR=1 FL=1